MGKIDREKDAAESQKHFSPREFRKSLWDDAHVISAMEKFVKLSRDRRREDVVLAFLNEFASPDATDLTHLLGEKLPVAQAQVVFNCLEAILLRISDGLQDQYGQWVEAIFGQLLQRGPIHNLKRCLMTTNIANVIVSALRLLTTVITASPSSARTVWSSFKITTDHLRTLLERPNRSEKLGESVRSATIVYLMAYLVTDDNALIRQFVDDAGILQAIFPSIFVDNASTIQMFLNTLLSKVVQNSAITKTSKIRFFSLKNLKALLKLFQWKRIKKIQTKNKKHSLSEADVMAIGALADDVVEEEESVRQISYHVLECICCSTDHGILFADTMSGMTGVNKNVEITKFLLTQDVPLSNPLMVDLFVSIVKSSPDQLVHYLPKLQKNLVVRSADAWINTMSYVRRMFEAQRPMDVLKLAEQRSDCVKLVQVALTLTTTSMLNREHLSKILVHEDLAVRHQGLLYLSTMIEKSRCLSDSRNPDFRAVFTKGDDVRKFVKMFASEFNQKLPAWHRLVSCWESAFAASSSLCPSPCVSLGEHVEAIVTAIAGYIDIGQAPSGDQRTDFILQKLLANFTTMAEKLQDCDRAVNIQLLTLKLLSEAHLNRYIAKEKIGKRSVILIVCDIVSGRDQEASVRLAASDLLKALLLASEFFTGAEREVDIWIKGLHDLTEVPDFSELLRSSLNELINDYDLLRDECGRLQMEAPQSIDLAANDLDEIAGDKTDIRVERMKESLQLAFSPMVLAVLRRLESSSPRCQKYASRLFVDVVHCQQSPELLCQFLLQYAHVLPRKCIRYLKSFGSDTTVSATPSEKLTSILQKRDLSVLIKEAFLSRTVFAVSRQTVDELVQDVKSDTDMLAALTRQLLVYVQVLVTNSSFYRLTRFFCEILKSLAISHATTSGLQVSCTIIEHPIIKDAFLREDLLVECPALTKLVLATVNCISNDQADLRAFYMDKALQFIAEMLRSIKNGHSKRLKLTLVDVLKPFEKHLKPSDWKTLISILSVQFTMTSGSRDIKQIEPLLIRILQIAANETNDDIMTADFVVLLANFHKTVNDTLADENCDFACGILHLFRAKPLCAFAIDEDYFLFCLNSSNKIFNIEIAETLMQFNFSNVASFAKWLQDSCVWRKRPELYLKVVCRFMKHGLLSLGYDSSLLPTIVKVYWHLLMDGMLANDEIATDAICSLLQLRAISTKKKTALCRHIVQAAFECGASLSVAVLKVFQQIASSVSQMDIEDISMPVLKIKVCLKTILNADSAADLNSDLVEMVTKALENDQKQLVGLLESLRESKLLKSVIKTCLKIGLKDSEGTAHLHLLRALLICLEANGELDGSQSALVFEMVFGHSNFLTAMSHPTSVKATAWKTSVLDLLVLLATANASVCKAANVPILLAAYEGYLRPVDERLLRLLYLHDANGVDMHSYKPFVWGQTAVHHYSVRKHLTNSLWKQPRMEEILALLDKDIMLRTALRFPLDVDLQVDKYVSDDGDGDEQASSRKNLIYDPRFLLPLFSHLLAPESLVHCTKFIDCNGLAVVFASLTSNEEAIRSAGSYILSCFCNHLEGHRSNNGLIWVYLLDLLRNALPHGVSSSASKPIPPLMATFLARTCHLIQSPTSAAAQPVINYLFVRPYLDLETVPEFYVLFSNSDVKHNIIRYWILGLLADGLRTHADFKLCQKRLVFKIILGFFESPLSSTQCKCSILQVLSAANRIPSVAIHLINRQGLLAFITSALRQFGDNGDILAAIVGIVSSAWTSTQSCATLTMQTQFIMVLVGILNCINASTSFSTFLDFVKTMASVLKCTAFDQAYQVVPGLTTSLIKKLLDTYESIVNSGESEATVVEAQTAACDILLKWRPQPTFNLTKKELFNYQNAFMASVTFWLNAFPPSAQNSERLLAIYKSVTIHLQQDEHGRLAQRLSKSSKEIRFIIHAYQYFLKASGIKSENNSIDILTNLNMILLTMAGRWISTSVTDECSENRFLKFLVKIKEVSSEPQMVTIINSMTSATANDCRFAAISFGILVCELWIGKEEPKHYSSFLKSTQEGNTKETTDLSPELPTRKRIAQDTIKSIDDVSFVKRHKH